VIKDENENDKKNALAVKFIVNKPNNEIIFNHLVKTKLITQKLINNFKIR